MNSFNGIPSETLAFLAELIENNNKPWFDENRDRYEKFVIQFAQQFVSIMGEKLQKINPEINYDTRTNGAGSYMRIHRDIRFSRNKSPYNTQLRFKFWKGSGKKSENPGFYITFEPNGGRVYCGIHLFSKEWLANYRQSVLNDQSGKDLYSIIETINKTSGYITGGESLKRVPRGYDPDHPRGNLLRLKGLWAAAPALSIQQLQSAELIDICLEQCNVMLPLLLWMASHN